VLRSRLFSTSSDVWSFGIAVWEIFAFGALPYYLLNNAEVTEFVQNRGRLEKPPHMPQNLFDLMLRFCDGFRWIIARILVVLDAQTSIRPIGLVLYKFAIVCRRVTLSYCSFLLRVYFLHGIFLMNAKICYIIMCSLFFLLKIFISDRFWIFALINRQENVYQLNIIFW